VKADDGQAIYVNDQKILEHNWGIITDNKMSWLDCMHADDNAQ